MSDTKRKIITFKKHNDSYNSDVDMILDIVDDTVARHKNYKAQGWKGTKIPPYAKSKGQKFYVSRQYSTPHHDAKEEVRNANRSLKKGLRQQYKKELQKELERIQNETD